MYTEPYDYGKKAYKDNLVRVPAADSAFMQTLKGKDPSAHISAFYGWLSGWDSACAAALMADPQDALDLLPETNAELRQLLD
jgi:hypothetical protein